MELTKSIAQVQADASLSDADKQAKIEQLEAEKAAFEDRLKTIEG
jgi:phosphonate transport system substrate-binding protein